MAVFDDGAVNGNRKTTALQEMNKRVALAVDPFALLDSFAGDPKGSSLPRRHIHSGSC